MASEPVEFQVLVLRVSIHCEGCKKKVKKVLLHVDGVYRCDIDARSKKVTVTASRKVDANTLVAKLRKSGKQAEPWPEGPKHEQPAESQSQETKNQNDEPSKPSEPAEEKSGPTNAEASAAEPSNAQPPPEPKKNTDETPKPQAQESKEAPDAKNEANGSASNETPNPATAQQPNEAKGKAKQQHQEEKPIDAKVTVEFDRGIRYGNHHMPTPQPVHVMSYNVARPTASASYYAASPTPMPMARPGPSQGYIDEYAPSYYTNTRASAYEPYYYPPQPSPYSYQHSSADDYYYGAPPQRSAFSPPRDAYGDMFNDENANSCSVM